MEEQFMQAKQLVDEKYSEEDPYYGVYVLGMYGLIRKYPHHLSFIQKLFRKTEIIIEKGLISKTLQKHNLSFQDIDEREEQQLAANGGSLPAISYSGIFYFIDRSNHFKRADGNPLVIVNGLCPPSFLLNSFIHEMNHMIKSQKHAFQIEKKAGIERCSIRNGMEVSIYEMYPNSDDIDEMTSYNIFDEAINTIQTSEMIQDILALDGIIPIPCVQEFLDSCDKDDFEDDPMYQDVIEVTLPLLKNPHFRSLVDENLIIGHLKPIEEDFESKLGKGSLMIFSDLLDELEDEASYSNNSKRKKALKKQIAKYVQAYNEKSYAYQK